MDAEGRERVLREGHKEGKRELVLRLLDFKFGELLQVSIDRIRRIESDALLDQLIEQCVAATALSELQLGDTNNLEIQL